MNGVTMSKQINRIILQTHILHSSYILYNTKMPSCDFFFLPTGPDFPTGGKNGTVKSIFEFDVI